MAFNQYSWYLLFNDFPIRTANNLFIQLLKFTGSFAAACGDTWSSELGSVMSNKQPVLITNFKTVPKGNYGLIL